MRWKILAIFLAGLGLAACETTPADTGAGTVATGGTTSTTGSGSQGTAENSSIASIPLTTGPKRGTQEDLVTNVGDRVFFDFDSVQLSPEARATLERQSVWLKQNANVDVWIEGRASAIRDYLVALGIDQSRMKTRSYGKERPVDPRSTEEAWSKNRRGVVVIQ